MNEEMITDVVEVVDNNADVIKDTAEEVSKSLPSGAYVGIGAGVGLAVAGLGTLAWKKLIKPAIDKFGKKKEKATDEAANNKAKEESSEEETTEEEK